MSPDLVLVNGKIFTSDPAHPYVEALAVRGDRIVAVGTSTEIIALAGTETKRIDVGGRTVILDINDAHVHLCVAPYTYELTSASRGPSWHEAQDAVSAAVAKVPKGTWIRGDRELNGFFENAVRFQAQNLKPMVANSQ